jgi:hypothetical protein
VRRYKLHVRMPLQNIPEILHRFDPELDRSGHKISLKTGPTEDIGTIVTELAKADIVVQNITSAEPSLEEIFLRLTQPRG